jgi:hypothetical protein
MRGPPGPQGRGGPGGGAEGSARAVDGGGEDHGDEAPGFRAAAAGAHSVGPRVDRDLDHGDPAARIVRLPAVGHGGQDGGVAGLQSHGPAVEQ